LGCHPVAVHIYTQTIHRTIQNNNTYNTTILEECGPCPVLASITMAFALQPRKKHGKTSVRVAASRNKICNKYHLLHLVGVLFPHNNDDARSKSLQC